MANQLASTIGLAVRTRSVISAALLLSVFWAQAAQATPTCYRNPSMGLTEYNNGVLLNTYPEIGPCHTLSLWPPSGVTVKGLMILIAAGGWHSQPQSVRDMHNRHAQRFANDGYITHTIEHTAASGTALNRPSGDVGMANVKQHYDELRAYVDANFPNGTTYPICAFGESSGGNFAMLLGVTRPKLNCVIAQGAPTDLRTGAAGLTPYVRQLAIDAFGEANLAAYSPIAWPAASYLKQGVLLGHGAGDTLVGQVQATNFCNTRPSTTKCIILDTTNGTQPFTHINVTSAALSNWQAWMRYFAPTGRVK
jgi:hypothetical protein